MVEIEDLKVAINTTIGDYLNAMGKDAAFIIAANNLFLGLMKEFPQLPTMKEILESVKLGYYWRTIVTDKDLGNITLATATTALQEAGLLDFLPSDKVQGITATKTVIDCIEDVWENIPNVQPPKQDIRLIRDFLEERHSYVQKLASVAIGSNVKISTFIDAICDPAVDLIKLPLFSGESFPHSTHQALLNIARCGHKIKILGLSPGLVQELEGNWGSPLSVASKPDWVKELDAFKNVEIRVLDEFPLSFFSGLLTFKALKDGNLVPQKYRVNVATTYFNRRTSGVFVQGEGATTIFKILDYYFDKAWEISPPLKLYGKPLHTRALRIAKKIFLNRKIRMATLILGVITLICLPLITKNQPLAFVLLAVLLPIYLSIPDILKQT